MKLRIKGDTLRLRLSQDDITQLKTHNRLEAVCRFSPTSSLIYQIISSQELTQADLADHHIVVMLTKDQIATLTNDEEAGISAVVDNGHPEGLKILVEKDYQCLIPRAHEDESNLYPNPLSNI